MIGFTPRVSLKILNMRNMWRNLPCNQGLGSFVLLGVVLCLSVITGAQETPQRTVFVPTDPTRDIPGDVKDAIKNAAKKTVFEVVGTANFSERVLKTDKLIFQPGSTLIMTGLRTGDSIIIIAGEVILQDPTLSSTIMRDPRFVAKSGDPGPNGPVGQPDFIAVPRRMSMNGGAGGNGENGTSGETFKPPMVYILVEKMTHPDIPSRFRVDFSGVQGGTGGAGGAGGPGGHGDIGWTAHCTRLGACDSEPGIGGDGGPGGTGGRGADAVPGGPGFDLVIAGSRDFVHIAEQFTILNQGGEPGLPGAAGPNGPPGRRGQGGQICGTCDSRGDGVDGPRGGTLGPGNPSGESGPGGHITFATGVDVQGLLNAK